MTQEHALSMDYFLRLLGQLDDDTAKASIVISKALKPDAVRLSASESSEPVANLLGTYRFRSRESKAGVRGMSRLVEVLGGMPPTDRLRSVIAESEEAYIILFVDMTVRVVLAVLLREGKRPANPIWDIKGQDI
jgi:hypothetical protein